VEILLQDLCLKEIQVVQEFLEINLAVEAAVEPAVSEEIQAVQPVQEVVELEAQVAQVPAYGPEIQH
tara:strand:+ start:1335 stop:1535 length:201 start_codon:yes stop_codon:yes gene_type:complete